MKQSKLKINRNCCLISLFIFLLVVACNRETDTGKFVSAPCPVKVPEELVTNGKFSFGYMKVPEFHSKPYGNTIELAVAVFKFIGDIATHEPLIFVTGGPGSSDIGGWVPLLSSNFGKLFLDNRDVVIIELRGLRYSNPNLLIPEIDSLQMTLLDKNYTEEKTIELYLETLKKAYDRFTNQGINLSAYNNYEMADDIAFIMENLGYPKFTIFGVSFGTMGAQHVILKYPDRVVCGVLNATVDIQNGFSKFHVNSIKTLDAIFEECKSDPVYAKAFPEQKNRFLALIKQLNEHPDTITIKNPSDKKDYQVVLNGNKLSVWLFAGMYYNTQVPLTLQKILAKDYSEIQAQPDLIFPLKNFSHGLSVSIIESESSNIKDEQIPVNGEYGEFIKGCGTMMFTPYFINQAKKVWIVDDLSQRERTINSDVPILMFNGELDHLCHADYLNEMTKRLNNKYFYLFPGVAHSPIEVGMCGISMMKEFIDDPSKAPNDSCFKEFRYSGFLLPKL